MTNRSRGLFFCLIALPAIFLFSPKEVLAAEDILINEFSSTSNPEWIEIYNPTDQEVSLNEVVLILDENSDTTQTMSFCTNGLIAAGSFKQIIRSTGSYWLNNEGDAIILKRGDDVIDAIYYGNGQLLNAPSETQSASRNPDGGADWIILDAPTPQGDIVSFECPTPTPEPTTTPEPEPTEEPTPTPTLIPTSTPTPTKKPTPKLTPTPTIEPTPTGEVLAEEATPTPEPTSTPAVLGGSARDFTRFIPFALIGIGTLFLASSGGLVLSPKLKKYYNRRRSGVIEEIT